ncbi:haloalkane dehalogenase [Rubrobacter aplysinae]|uniref:haloalkane dehalogenase n=1 Tax=Rubrobacter aplysinae TaxID=909625 RepID=UPI00064BDBE2|nr:haloalkane dehalogenase [Rubrobacter aplysinae]
MDIYRTPEERFSNLPGFPYEPRYREWEGMRLAYIDEGPRDAPPVVLLHGEPTWSYLYRKVMGPLLEAGYRCVVPDLPGFGRSDKPTDDDWYTYARHTDAMVSLMEELDLSNITLVVQDWGGPIGFRVAALECPERVGRFVVMDTGVFTGHQRMSREWLQFRDFVARNPDVPVGMLIERATVTGLPSEVVSAYEAPFPDERSKAGPRTFPPLIPLEPDDPGAAEGQRVAQALSGDGRPALFLWADSDPVLPLDPVGHALAELFPNAEAPETVESAGHFLQEDAGDRIGRRISDWLVSDRPAD